MKDIIDTELGVKTLMEFVSQQNSKVWHQMMMGWNWDSYTEIFDWLIENPETDKATILMIYWRSEPGRKYKLEHFSNKKMIEDRYINNFYKTQEILFDPKDDMGDDLTDADYIDDITIIPSEMYQKLDGEYVPYNYDSIEGMPLALAEKIEAIELRISKYLESE